MKVRPYVTCVVFLIAVLGACRPTDQNEADTLIMPTNVSQQAPVQSGESQEIALTLPPPPTMVIVDIAGPAEEATPEPVISAPTFQVAYVERGDVLNVRSGPGVENEVVGSISRDQSGITITGRGQMVSGSTWVPVSADGIAGWVNGRFLVQSFDEGAFCHDEDVQRLLGDLKNAIGSKDGDLLSEIIHPERGMRVRLNWWNPEILIRGSGLAGLFADSTRFAWGTEDGSGREIEGSFSDTVLPMLEEDLLGATETACDEILQGGTAGLVKLPDDYPHINYYSFYRPGTDEFSGLNWGTWVIGMEKWQNRNYISFLIHYGWEI